MYIMELAMNVGKWGNSLAVRLPKEVVDALDLKEGDEIEITIAGKRNLKVERDKSREDALKKLRAMRWPLPPGFKFDRDDAHER